MKMEKLFKAIRKRQEGQTMAEYAVVLGVITLAVVGVFTALAGGINSAITSVTVNRPPGLSASNEEVVFDEPQRTEADTMRKPTLRKNGQRGQAIVEFAIIIPILLTVLLGIMQLGVVYNNWVGLTDAARAGARKGAVCRTGCSPSASTATTNAVKASAANLDRSKLGVTVTSTWAQGADLTVRATYPWSVNILGIVVAGGTMVATTTERVE